MVDSVTAPAAAPAVAVALQLPGGIVTRADTGRLCEEVEALDNFLNQAAVREPGTAVQLPKASRLFDEIVAINKLNLLQKVDRERLLKFLQGVRTKAPTLHISFNVDPSAVFQQNLITWIRQQIHPETLLQIGLYPSIGAGCVVRATNKFYDFSFRQKFTDQKQLLITQMRGEVPMAAPAVTTPATPAPPVAITDKVAIS